MPQPHTLQIEGTVSPEFESVKDLFARQMHTMAERQAQLCVYHRGQRVVDLWADTTGEGGYDADSIANVFSSGKSLEAIAVAWLVDRELLQYSHPIIEYWPEFGTNGKAELTVADLMRHEAGLASFDTSIDMQDLFRENIKQNAIGQLIEQQSPRYTSTDGSKREYHALTRGWIVNELFRRVDPQQRTIGEFLQEEISGPLQVDVMIGVPDEQRTKVIPVKPLTIGYQLRQSLVPKFMGRPVMQNGFHLSRRLLRVLLLLRSGGKNGPPPPFSNTTNAMEFFSHPDWITGETPSANANCSARGLAKIAAMMAAGGTFAERQYLSERAWNAMHEHPQEATMGKLLTTRFTQGGVDQYQPTTANSGYLERAFNQGREGFVGWMGFGGSIFQWHPELDIGFAFVPTSLHVLDLLNERGKRYQAEVLRCVHQVAAA